MRTYHFHDLLHTFKLLSHRERLRELHLSSQREVLPDCQLLIVGSSQLKDVASVGHIPITDFFNRDTVNVDLTLQWGERGKEGEIERGREREGGGREKEKEKEKERQRQRQRERRELKCAVTSQLHVHTHSYNHVSLNNNGFVLASC